MCEQLPVCIKLDLPKHFVTKHIQFFESLIQWIHIYKNHKLSMIRIQTLQYSVESWVFDLHASFVFGFYSFFVNAATTKTVNFYKFFEWLESFISIFLNLWIWMRKLMNQTYFECYEFDVNSVIILIATCIYKSRLNWVRMNQSSWISILLLKISWVLMSSKKAINCKSLIHMYKVGSEDSINK